jgi:hypothetical protein
LRSLFIYNEKEFPLKPLEKRDCERLELKSKEYKDVFEQLTKDQEKKGKTYGSFEPKPTEWQC